MYKHDGETRQVQFEDLKVGNTLRSVAGCMSNESSGRDVVDSFSDCVIVEAYWRDNRGQKHQARPGSDNIALFYVRLARPHCKIIGNTIYTAVEDFEVSAVHIIRRPHWVAVLDTKGIVQNKAF